MLVRQTFLSVNATRRVTYGYTRSSIPHSILAMKCQCRLSSSAREETSKQLSKNKQFKQIPTQPSILDYIRRIGVGRRKDRRHQKQLISRYDRLARGRRSTSAAKSSSDEQGNKKSSSLSAWDPPLPFGANARPVEIIASVSNVDQDDKENHGFPYNKSRAPEVAIIGRSNVGKSTLLNALLYGNRNNDQLRNLGKTRGPRTPERVKLPKGKKATTSDRPGETRSITFYQLESKEKNEQSHCLWLVDLPGYGFAYSSEDKYAIMQQLVTTYILERGKGLKRILLLLDARHGIKKTDIDFLKQLEQELYGGTKAQPRALPPIQLVLTKCDLVDQVDLARRVVLVRQEFSDALRREQGLLPIMLVSARAGVGYNRVVNDCAQGGILELQRELAGLYSKGRTGDSSKVKRTRTGNSKKDIQSPP